MYRLYCYRDGQKPLLLKQIYNHLHYSYPVLDQYTYLNTSGIGLIPNEHMEAANAYNKDLLENGSIAFERWRSENYPRLRKLVSDFVGCSNSELAFLPNFSFGLVGLMPILVPFEKVLLYRDDYPSLRDPFVLHGFDVSWVDSEDGFFIDQDEIKRKLLNDNIRLLAISHVQYLSGFKVDVEDLGKFCRENGIIFVVDTTQSLGRIPINFNDSGMTIMISSNYKWMNAGFGSALMCIKQEFLEAHPAKVAGYGSYTFTEEGFIYKPSILSYEGGHLNCSGLNILEAAIAQKHELGFSETIIKGNELMKRLLEGLRQISYPIIGNENMDHRAGIVCVPGDEEKSSFLKEKNVILTFRNGHFRLGPHFYNSEEEIDNFLAILDQVT